MSIQSEITRIEQAKSDIASSIAGKGVVVPSDTTIDGFSALIDSISTGGSSGSSVNNCEAYIVDVTNPVVNFVTTSGTIKAWGYAKGTTSGYTTPQYAFMGDTYLSISSWGSGSTSSLSLSVDSSGNLSGLPSSLASGTILVTRGI